MSNIRLITLSDERREEKFIDLKISGWNAAAIFIYFFVSTSLTSFIDWFNSFNEFFAATRLQLISCKLPIGMTETSGVKLVCCGAIDKDYPKSNDGSVAYINIWGVRVTIKKMWKYFLPRCFERLMLSSGNPRVRQ